MFMQIMNTLYHILRVAYTPTNHNIVTKICFAGDFVIGFKSTLCVFYYIQMTNKVNLMNKKKTFIILEMPTD